MDLGAGTGMDADRQQPPRPWTRIESAVAHSVEQSQDLAYRSGDGGGDGVARRRRHLWDFAGSANYLHSLAGQAASARNRKACRPRLPSGPVLRGGPSRLAGRPEPLAWLNKYCRSC